MAVVAMLSFACGAVLGPHLSPSYLPDKELREWLIAIGTIGTLVMVVAVANRERTWRLADRKAQGRVAWGLLVMETVRLSDALNRISIDLVRFQSPEVPHDAAFKRRLQENIDLVDSVMQYIKDRADSLTKLAPSVASNLGVAVGQYPEWRRAVTAVLAPPGEIDQIRAEFEYATRLTDAMLEKVANSINHALTPEDNQWN